MKYSDFLKGYDKLITFIEKVSFRLSKIKEKKKLIAEYLILEAIEFYSNEFLKDLNAIKILVENDSDRMNIMLRRLIEVFITQWYITSLSISKKEKLTYLFKSELSSLKKMYDFIGNNEDITSGYKKIVKLVDENNLDEITKIKNFRNIEMVKAGSLRTHFSNLLEVFPNNNVIKNYYKLLSEDSHPHISRSFTDKFKCSKLIFLKSCEAMNAFKEIMNEFLKREESEILEKLS